MFDILTNKYKTEAMGNDISSRLKFAALHDCETKWKTCGGPKKVPGHGVDKYGIPESG
eukprot:CAMPEP_0173378682 /NCGR_PEP_ID=MMETSP1356-20130122/1810_1 /TAXON_ID=77927 ORGANISM="Hemiselmis virescens, Strain PCC157" /NCGR_SAMPLE_ID=MMETSP1356 /ASSEMBLY_ACC=CAM_ASM_000847 /LENGTH=57 /DNA_ID=CAMNT_0014331825 /DNA_START=13 /DNA_END=186 /DNA_ORIENTATION=+